MSEANRHQDNFSRALANLEAYRDKPESFDILTLTGFIGLYEICFEQSWKAMKEALDNQGVTEAKTGSPRMILKQAYKTGLIKDEHAWLQALQARNEVAHSYSEDVAHAIVNQTRTSFLDLFEELEATLKSWNDTL